MDAGFFRRMAANEDVIQETRELATRIGNEFVDMISKQRMNLVRWYLVAMVYKTTPRILITSQFQVNTAAQLLGLNLVAPDLLDFIT